MFKYSKDGVSVLTTQDTRRKKQSGLYPIKIQIVFNRNQRYYITGKELSKEEWKLLPSTKNTKFISIRSDIKNSFEKVEKAVRSLVEDDSFSFDELNKSLSNYASETLSMAFQAKIDKLIKEGAIGNADVYTSAYRH